MSTLTATIDKAVTAADATQPVLPIGAFHQALAAFDEDGAINNVLWPGMLASGVPIEGVSGAPCTAATTTASAVPTITSANALIPERLPPKPLTQINPPTIDTVGSGNLGLKMPTANFTASWSVAFIVYFDGAASPNGLWADAGPVAGQKAAVWGASGNLRVGQVYGSTLFTVADVWKVGANIVLVCFDATARQYAVYLNSQTAKLSGAVGADPAPAAAGEYWYFGNKSDGGAATGGKVPAFATFNTSIHHNAALAAKRRQLIAAAAEAYNIAIMA